MMLYMFPSLVRRVVMCLRTLVSMPLPPSKLVLTISVSIVASWCDTEFVREEERAEETEPFSRLEEIESNRKPDDEEEDEEETIIDFDDGIDDLLFSSGRLDDRSFLSEDIDAFLESDPPSSKELLQESSIFPAPETDCE